MSEDKEQKYLGNAKLSQKPERKLVLRLGKDVVNTPNIKDGAVTAEKLNENVATDYIQPMLDGLKEDIEKQIVSIETGGLALSDLLGNSEFVGINQKTLTRYINDLQSQIELLESNVVIIQSWGDLVSLTKGTHRYDPETDTLYAVREVTTYSEPDENGIATPDTHLEWVVVPMNSKTLYLRNDTLEWYKYVGEKLIPIGTRRVDISELDTFINLSDLHNSSAGVYTVVDKEIGYNGVDGKIGILSIFESFDENTITQVFTTRYVPVDGIFSSTNKTSNIPKTYYRTSTDWEIYGNAYSISTHWSLWQELSAHVDVDDELGTSENPVMNRVVTAKFEDVDNLITELRGAQKDVIYFDDYDESNNITFMDDYYNGTGNEGKIVYMTNYNVFAFKVGTFYYTKWDNSYGRIPSDNYNIENENTGEISIREDKNFLLLTEDGGLPFTIDSTLNSESANPVQNKAIYNAFSTLKPFVFTYYGDSIFEGNVIAFLDYSSKYNSLESAFEGIGEAFAKGVNVVFKPSVSNVHVKTVFTLTQFDKKDVEDNTVTNPCVGTVVGSDGFYSILINKSPGYQGNDPLESITFRRDVAFDRSLSMGDKSMLLMNSTSVSPQNWVANIDGSFLVYSYIDNKLYKLNQKDSSYIVESDRVTPSKNIIYVDPAVNKCYRWNNDNPLTAPQMVSIGGGNVGNDPNTISALQEKVDALMALLDVSSTGNGNNKVYSSKKLNSLTNIIGDNTEDDTYTDSENEEHLTLTARLLNLETAGYLTEHQDLSNYATKEDLNTKADKGHRVIILAYYQSSIPSVEDANSLHESMPNGIYWLDPTGTGGVFLHKGTYVEEGGIERINWSDDSLSEEVLYVTKNPNNQKTFIATKVTNQYGTISWEFIDVPFISNTPVRVSINVDTADVELSCAFNEYGAWHIPKEFSIVPREYANQVSITIKEKDSDSSTAQVLSSDGMLLQPGEYTVIYSVDSDGSYTGTSISYNVIVTQTPAQQPAINYYEGNLGEVMSSKSPEYIDVQDVDIYKVPDLYEGYKRSDGTNMVYKSGSNFSGQPHLFTYDEIKADGERIIIDNQEVTLEGGLQPLEVGSDEEFVGRCNYVKIMKTLENADCIGFKLDQQYPVYLEFVYNDGTAITSAGTDTTPDPYKASNTLIVLPRDFIIDGEVSGHAVGGFINVHLAQGSMFYTEYSLYLNKVHISAPAVENYSIPSVFINCEYGIGQLQAIDCIFDGYDDYSGSYCFGLFFRNLDPTPDDAYTIDSSGNDTNIRTGVLRSANRIEHIYIKGCTCNKNLITNFGRLHCVLKSFRIINNTINNVQHVGILFSLQNDLNYGNKMAYVSCPCWIIGNIITGKYGPYRATTSYYCGFSVENSILYALHNTIKDFMSYYVSGNNGDIASTYDMYFNGKQLYYANNTVINVLCPSLKGQATSGIIKGNSLGYYWAYANSSDTTSKKTACIKSHFGLLPPVRYWKYNNYVLNPEEINQLYEGLAGIGSLNEVMTIVIGTEDNKFNVDGRPIKDFVFSNNIVNAIWDGDITDFTSKGSDTGNILGVLGTTQWLVVNTELNNNKFIATRMSSEDWGYDIIRQDSYPGNKSYTHLFNIKFDNKNTDSTYNYKSIWKVDSRLSICNNLFEAQESEQISVLCSKYYPTKNEGYDPDITPISFSNNRVPNGNTIRILSYNMSGPGNVYRNVRYSYSEPSNAPELFNHSICNSGDITIPNGPAESINYSDINNFNITDIYDSYKIEKDGEMVYPTTDDVGMDSTIPHLWTAEEIGLVDIPDTSANGAINTANSNTISVKNAMNNQYCIGFKLDKQYWVNTALLPNIEDPLEDCLHHFTDIRPFIQSAIEIPKDFIIDGEVDGEAVGGLIQFDGDQGAMFYTSHSLYVNKMYVRSPCHWKYDIPYFCIDCREGIDQIQFIDCKFDRYTGVAKYATGMYIGLWINDIDPLDSNNYQIASNYINHVYIKSCDVLGNFIGCGENGYRILKSCRITGNTIHDIRNIGISLAPLRLKQRPNRDGEYASKNAYVSCPIWMYENIFVGIDPVVESGVVSMGKIKRPSYDIFCGALIESNVLYSLGNTFTDFVTAPSVYQHGGNTGAATEYSQIRCASTYDQYFNGRQLYYANNIVHNVINLFESQGTNGCFTAEKVGYHVPATTLPVIRYYANNNIELCPYEVKTYWGEQNENKNNDPITIARIANENVTTATDNLNTIIIENEKAVSLNTWMNMKINAKYVDADCPIDELTIINNTFNAIVESAQYNGDHIVGNIDGMRNADSLYAYKVTITGNTFKADNIASEEWGHYFLEDGNYINNNSTWLLSLGLVRNQDNNLLTISDNDVYVEGNTSQNVHLCLIKYGLGDAQYITNADGAYYTSSNNNITSGKTLLIGKIDAQGWRTEFKESIEGSLSAEE